MSPPDKPSPPSHLRVVGNNQGSSPPPSGFPPFWGEHRELPNPSRSHTIEVSLNGQALRLRVDEYDWGQPGRILLEMHKEGSAFKALCTGYSEALSMALQYGLPLEKLVEQFRFSRFDPSGIVDGHPKIKNATSIFDFVAQHLMITYLVDEA